MVTNSNHARNIFLFYSIGGLGPTNFLTLLNNRLLKVNNSGFDLSPIDMVIFDELKKGKAQLKMAMKAFKKREKVEDKM